MSSSYKKLGLYPKCRFLPPHFCCLFQVFLWVQVVSTGPATQKIRSHSLFMFYKERQIEDKGVYKPNTNPWSSHTSPRPPLLSLPVWLAEHGHCKRMWKTKRNDTENRLRLSTRVCWKSVDIVLEWVRCPDPIECDVHVQLQWVVNV